VTPRGQRPITSDPSGAVANAWRRALVVVAALLGLSVLLLPADPSILQSSPAVAAATSFDGVTYGYDGALQPLTARPTSTHDRLHGGARLAGHAKQQVGPVRSNPMSVFAAEDGARLASRTDQLTGALDPIAQNSRTSAVMSTRQGADVLAGGGRDLSPAQRALGQGDDVLGRLPGAHAEITAMDAAGKAGLTPWQMAVSRPICPACQSAIEGSGGTVPPGGMFAWWPW